MARFDETVNIQTPDLRTGGVQRALSLADRLEGFRTRSLGLAQEQAVQRGIKSAGETELQKEDIDGRQVTISPQKKEKRFIGGIEINAHNKTLQAAYMASLDNDTRNGVNDIVSKNKDNLAGFDTAIEGFRKGVMKGVDPAIRQAVEIDLSGRIDSARTQVQAATVKRENAEAKAEINANANNASNEAYRLARNGGDTLEAKEERLRALVSIDHLGLPPDKKAERKREVMREYDENIKRYGLDQTIEKQGLPAAIDELAELEKEVPKGWTPDEWDRFIEGEQIDLNKKLNAQLRAARESAEKAKKETDFSAIEKRLGGDDTQIINPKTLGKYYDERVAPLLESMPIEQRQATQASFIDSMKQIPSTIKAQITNAANSDNPDLLREAAMLIDRIDDIRGVVEQIPKKEQAYLVNVVGLLDNMEPKEAIDLARRATDPRDKPRIEAAQARLDKIKNKPEVYREKAQDAFDGGYFGFQTDIDEISGAQLGKEYGVMYENNVLSGMSDSDATAKAAKKIQGLWGVDSTMGADRIMKYPLATYYAINGDTMWIMRDLVKDVNANVAGGGITAKDIVLMANDETARTATIGEPTYLIKVLIDGAFQSINQRGQSPQWKPDFDKEKNRVRSLNTKAGIQQRKESLKEAARISDLDFGIAP